MKMIFLKNTYDVDFRVTNDLVYNWVITGQVVDKEAMLEMVCKYEDHLNKVLDEKTTANLDKQTMRKEFLEVLEKRGTDENERAMYAPCIWVNGEPMAFTDVKEMVDAVSRHQLQIEEVYEGFIY